MRDNLVITLYIHVYIVWNQFKYKCSSFWGKLLLNNDFLLWLMCYNLCRSTNHLGFPIQAKINMYTGPSNLYWRTIGLNDLYKYLTNQLLSASFFVFLRLVYPMLPVTLDCPFGVYSLTFIHCSPLLIIIHVQFVVDQSEYILTFL